jgi:hypothetical protein
VTTITELDLVTGKAAKNPILDLAGEVNWQHARHNLYVVKLRDEIFKEERKFSKANPHWLPGQPCVYVGMTGLTPEKRFQKHVKGEKDAWFVHRYGQRLLPDFYRPFNPMPTTSPMSWNQNSPANSESRAMESGRIETPGLGRHLRPPEGR